MAFRKRHMFYILFNAVLLTSAIAAIPGVSDVNVSRNVGRSMRLTKNMTGHDTADRGWNSRRGG